MRWCLSCHGIQELWSYGFDGGTLGAVRYGSGADIQLWSTTDLAVQFVLDRVRTVLLALSLIIMAKTAWVLAPIVAPVLG